MNTKKILILAVCSLFSLKTLASTELERVEAASTLAEVIGLKNTTEAGFNAMLPLLEQQGDQLGLNADESIEFMSIYKDWFHHDIDHDLIHDQVVALYADTFTAEELNILTEFYQSPLGIKALSELPKLMQLGAQIGMDEGTKKQQALLERLTPFLNKIEEKKKLEKTDENHQSEHK